MCLLIVQPVFFFFALWLCSISLELCLARHHHLSLLWGMAQGNIYDALCTKWVQPFKSPEQLNSSSSSHFSCEQRLCRYNRIGVPGVHFSCEQRLRMEPISLSSASGPQRRIWARQGPIFYPKNFWPDVVRAYWNPKARQGPNLACLACRGGPVPKLVQI